jgi:hypothetical protein
VVVLCVDGSRAVWVVALVVGQSPSLKLPLWHRDQEVGSEADLEEVEEDSANVAGVVSVVVGEGVDLEDVVGLVTEEDSEAEGEASETGEEGVVDSETGEAEVEEALETEEEADSEAEEMTSVEEVLGNRFVLTH